MIAMTVDQLSLNKRWIESDEKRAHKLIERSKKEIAKEKDRAATKANEKKRGRQSRAR